MAKRFLGVLISILVVTSLLVITGYNNKFSSKDSSIKQIKGIILPHHRLAEELFHSSLKRVSENQTPDLIVIFGTNHHYQNGPNITTSLELSNLNVDTENVSFLKQNFPDILIDKNIVENEHSIVVTASYIKQYFPNTKIIPLVVSSQYSEEDINMKAKFLTTNLPSHTLYVASVDFSHDVLLEEGLKNNEESIKAISSFNLDRIYGFNNKYMDSPISIVMFLLSMKYLGGTEWEAWTNSHSALIKNDPFLQGTSYVIGVFRD